MTKTPDKRDVERANNRLHNAKKLIEAGVPFESKRNGTHLVIRAPSKDYLYTVLDYWPGTERWTKRHSNKYYTGTDELIAAYHRLTTS